MGVIRKVEPISIDHAPMYNFEDHIADFVFDDDLVIESDIEDSQAAIIIEAIVAPPPPESPRRRRNRNRGGRKAINARPMDINLALRHGQKGARKAKRLEDARILSLNEDQDDVCQDFSDTLPDMNTAFSKLFIDEQAMNAWQEFLSLDEGEQMVLLEHGIVSVNDSQPSSSTMDDDQKLYDRLFESPRRLGGSRSKKGERRAPKNKHATDKDATPRTKGQQPFSCKECFNRIDGRLRQLLTGGSVPWGRLSELEEQLIDFFDASPDGVFLARFDSGYDRLLLHAAAQYLSLRSKSSNCPSAGSAGERQTCVENLRPYFVPPRTRLSAYLTSRKANRAC